MSLIEVRTEEEPDSVRLILSGELDLSSAALVEEELARVERDAPRRIVLDLSGLRFMDSTGLRLIVAADSRAREQDRGLAIVQGPESVRRVFEITGLEQRLEFMEGPAAGGDASS